MKGKEIKVIRNIVPSGKLLLANHSHLVVQNVL